MNVDIRSAVLARAAGVCECGCGDPLVLSFDGVAELDHFFGRARVPEAVSNCWALRRNCHGEKTDNRPSAASWLQKFIAHANRHGYENEAGRAWTRLAVLRQKGFA